MIAVPVVTPETIPVVAPTVATATLLLLHVPPPGLSVRVVVAPVQTSKDPVMPDVMGMTVIVLITKPHAVI